MTVEELMLYSRLEDEIYERAKEICEKTNLKRGNNIDPFVKGNSIIISILDHYNNEIDRLTMRTDQFVSDDYLIFAKSNREYDEEQKRKAAIEAKKKAEIEMKESRRRLYEQLKKEFEGELYGN